MSTHPETSLNFDPYFSFMCVRLARACASPAMAQAEVNSIKTQWIKIITDKLRASTQLVLEVNQTPGILLPVKVELDNVGLAPGFHKLKCELQHIVDQPLPAEFLVMLRLHIHQLATLVSQEFKTNPLITSVSEPTISSVSYSGKTQERPPRTNTIRTVRAEVTFVAGDTQATPSSAPGLGPNVQK